MSITWSRGVLWAAPALLLGLPMVSSFAQDGSTDEVRKKLDEIRKQISDLRDKEKALLEKEQAILKLKAEQEREARAKEAERKRMEAEAAAKREIAEKGKHYVKVEIRGKLVRAMGPFSTANTYLHVNEVHWPLSFSDAKGPNKTLQADAEKLLNKHVVVTGSISTKVAPYAYGIPNLPGNWPGNWSGLPGFPIQPDWNDRRWYPYTPTIAVNPTLIVETIKLAQ